VLKVGSGTRGERRTKRASQRGLVAVILGSVASAGLAIVTATRVAPRRWQVSSGRDHGLERLQRCLVPRAARRGALVGLIGRDGDADGLVISWVIAVPILTSMQPAADAVTLARTPLRSGGRRCGSSAPAHRLLRRSTRWPGLRSRWWARLVARSPLPGQGLRGRLGPRSLNPVIIALTAACLGVAAYLAFTFARSTALAPSALALTLIAVPLSCWAAFSSPGSALHGGLDRRSNSPDLGRRHPVDRALCFGNHPRRVADSGDAAGASRLRSLFVTAIVSRARPSLTTTCRT